MLGGVEQLVQSKLLAPTEQQCPSPYGCCTRRAGHACMHACTRQIQYQKKVRYMRTTSVEDNNNATRQSRLTGDVGGSIDRSILFVASSRRTSESSQLGRRSSVLLSSYYYLPTYLSCSSGSCQHQPKHPFVRRRRRRRVHHDTVVLVRPAPPPNVPRSIDDSTVLRSRPCVGCAHTCRPSAVAPR